MNRLRPVIVAFLFLSPLVDCVPKPAVDVNPWEADYLIVAPKSFTAPVERLAAYRKGQGLRVSIRDIDASDATAGKETSRLLNEIVRKRSGKRALYVLLCGDARNDLNPDLSVAARIVDASYRGKYDRQMSRSICTDAPVDPENPLFRATIVGRFPADTVAEMDIMVDKTIRFETAPRSFSDLAIDIIGGAPGFGVVADRLIESIFARIVTECIPPSRRVSILYASPDSPYSPYPPSLRREAVNLFNASPLLYAYVGHAGEESFAPAVWKERRYPVMEIASIREMKRQSRPPLFFSIACASGYIDGANDCIGEELMKSDCGPAIFFGASRNTHPSGNALLGMALLTALGKSGKGDRIGDLLLRAREGIATGAGASIADNIRSLTALFDSQEEFNRIVRDTQLAYNLLGDPALRLPYVAEATVRTAASVKRGWRCPVVIDSGIEGEIRWRISLRYRRNDAAAAAAREGESEEDFRKTYNRANKMTIVETEIVCRGEVHSAIDIPAGLSAGNYDIVAEGISGAELAAGSASIEITD